MNFIKTTLSALALVSIMTLASCAGSGTKEVTMNDSIVTVAAEKVIPNENITPGVYNLAKDEYLSFEQGYGYPIVVDFNATWCGPCRAFAPLFDKMAEKYSGQIQFISVDVDRCPEVANAFEVQSIPFIIFVSPDGKIDSHVGMMEEADFDAALQKLL